MMTGFGDGGWVVHFLSWGWLGITIIGGWWYFARDWVQITPRLQAGDSC